MKRLCFVLPRFGETIIGGAETLVGNLARKVSEAGHEVHVYTTCAKDNRTWANDFPAEMTEAYGIPVTRFPVDERDLESWIPRQISIADGMRLGVDEELEWMQHSVNSCAMYEQILKARDDFDAFLFAPYLFGTTFWGALIHPDKSILIPCLHDESYAYTDVIGSMFRQVKGALFNAIPEQKLAQHLYGHVAGGEVGMGFEPYERRDGLEPYFDDDSPYILYVGRKETGKNVQLLIDLFLQGKEQQRIPEALKLVIVGGGDFSDLHRPGADERDDIIDLPPVTEEEKLRLIKHAQLLCQPSVNESFSIVLMEAWLLQTPVLVHAECAVTRHHVVESGGGLYFSDLDDFVGVLERLSSDNTLLQKLSEQGERYVRSHYSWSAVMQRFEDIMGELFES